ncbi:uncharacterized protein LOC111010366 isoform X2 [Momordica charantia]|uniref:Uncharacterized protein LOC111010366 isoform X2 n=1 Tax=Momordica charantia TaxID=3673 RepID=A0A6J1CDX9_MOMCH|nr:uncharacterized protein LOC111010366 isoform X2 [Momordica charantia]
MAAASEPQIAVFMDTDFGTRLAVAVPPGIAAGALKREVERVHFNCFPNIGEIKVDGFMVKQNSNFYHLTDTVLMKLTSQVDGVQFLHVKAQPLFNEHHLPENADCFPNLNDSTHSLERQSCPRGVCESKIRAGGKKRRRKRFRPINYLSRLVCRSILPWNTRRKRKRTSKNQVFEYVGKNSNMKDLIKDAENRDGSIYMSSYHCMPNDEAGTASELSSEVMSVSSIINRYFPSHDEVSSILNRSSCGITRSQPEEYLKKKKKNIDRGSSLLPLKLPLKAGSQKPERCKLGKRLVMASYNLGISPNRERPEISLCNSKGQQFQELMSLARSSCFEILDSDD